MRGARSPPLHAPLLLSSGVLWQLSDGASDAQHHLHQGKLPLITNSGRYRFCLLMMGCGCARATACSGGPLPSGQEEGAPSIQVACIRNGELDDEPLASTRRAQAPKPYCKSGDEGGHAASLW
jgi:hypothetical protein